MSPSPALQALRLQTGGFKILIKIILRVELFKVPVYFLNADFDYRNLLDFTAPDPDCLHTVIGVVVEMVLVVIMTIGKLVCF